MYLVHWEYRYMYCRSNRPAVHIPVFPMELSVHIHMLIWGVWDIIPANISEYWWFIMDEAMKVTVYDTFLSWSEICSQHSIWNDPIYLND